jgi:hypothetical protein
MEDRWGKRLSLSRQEDIFSVLLPYMSHINPLKFGSTWIKIIVTDYSKKRKIIIRVRMGDQVVWEGRRIECVSRDKMILEHRTYGRWVGDKWIKS